MRLPTFSEEQLRVTPSRLDDISAETELSLRAYGAELVQEAGILLRLPQVVMCTGQVLFQRFYHRASFRRFDAKLIAMACVFLAAKAEESPKKICDVINVFHAVENMREGDGSPGEPLDSHGQKYYEWKDKLIHNERIILRELAFVLAVQHPHKYVLTYVKQLGLGVYEQELAQKAWNFLNDSMRTDLCMRFKPEVIATAGIDLAARVMNLALPDRWWEVFDASREDVCQASCYIWRLYSLPRTKNVSATTNIPSAMATPTPNPDPSPATVEEESHPDQEVAPPPKEEAQATKEKDPDPAPAPASASASASDSHHRHSRHRDRERRSEHRYTRERERDDHERERKRTWSHSQGGHHSRHPHPHHH